MEGRNVSWETVDRKEKELIEFEEKHLLEKKNFETRFRELDERSERLHRAVDEEADKMYQTLKRFSASSSDLRDCFSEIENLRWQSELAYKRKRADLEEEEDEWEKVFRRKRNDLEEEYNQLRRDYASANQ